MLGPAAVEAFERAKRLAWTNGGVVSPLHLLIGALEALPTRGEAGDATRVSLAGGADSPVVSALRGMLLTRFPGAANSLLVSKETQSVISEAGKLAASEGVPTASPKHLIRAALASDLVKDAISGRVHLEYELIGACATTASSPAAPRPVLTGALADFCSDVADESRRSHLFVGRGREITAILETLCRKLKSNPLLIGKPGVGKTALVSAVAARLVEGTVPPRLRGRRVLEVSRLRLLADAKYSGEIEERLKQLLDEVRRAGNVILFFDEIHTLLNAGGASGTGDVANLLKSALSKGEITCIGATTLSEYYKYIARDEALARRFSSITIEEPSVDETRKILTDSRGAFESYHGVSIGDEAIDLIITMADRYIRSRSFPDKAFDLMDKAAAKATLGGHSSLTREQIAETLSELTGLPLDMMDEDPADRLERLEEFLNANVFGQPRAVRDVARVVRIAKLRLEVRPERPDGVFIFAGPDGVGKRELATALAKFLYGSAHKMIEFDMSQFAEQWSLSRLVGAEPGYVGYGERSGLLSKAAEDNPHSVLFFRNIDLAHQVTQHFLAEAFEQGRFTDATGAAISLSNATVVMSLSQIGESHKHAQIGFMTKREENQTRQDVGWWAGANLVEQLADVVDEVVEFTVLDQAATAQIIVERLDLVRTRLEAAQPVEIKLDPELVRFLADKLISERKSIGSLDRLLQEIIIAPFSQLRIDRGHDAVGQSQTAPVTASRIRVSVIVDGAAVKITIA